MADQFSQWFTDRQKFSQILGGKLRSSFGDCFRLSTDLNHTNNFSIGENRGADDSLNRRGRQGIRFYSFKHAGVTHNRKMVDNLRPTVAHAPSSESAGG